jgi:hypothetical protein
MVGVDTRKDELILRWWWRLQRTVDPESASRPIADVFEYRWQQVLAMSNTATSASRDPGHLSDVCKIRDVLRKYGFEHEWYNGIDVNEVEQQQWKSTVQNKVRGMELSNSRQIMAKQASLIDSGYIQTEQATQDKYSIAPYLDDVYNRKAVQVRLALRSGSLPLRATLGRHAKPRRWDDNKCYCPVCDRNVIEDTTHFLVECPFYDELKKKFMSELAEKLERDSDTKVRDYGRLAMLKIEELSWKERRIVLLDGICSLKIESAVRVEKDEIRQVRMKVEKTVNNYVWLCWKSREKQIEFVKRNLDHRRNSVSAG